MGSKRVLVTGGAGFIGSHLVDELVSRGHSVTVVDNLSSSTTRYLDQHIEKGRVTFFKKDIRDVKFLAENLSPVDTIYHMAADPDVKTSVEKPVNSFDTNVVGTVNLLEYMRKGDVGEMFFASSGGTLYGEVENFPISEAELLRPISPYGASKAASEVYLSAYANAYGLKIVSGRYANIFGPRSNHGVTYDFFHKLRSDPDRLQILGDGTQKKSYLYVDDCVAASLLLGERLERQERPYDFFNVGSDEWVTVSELAGMLVETLGLENVEFEYTGGDRGWVGDVPRMLLSVEKLKGLGWAPKYSFREGLELYIQWLTEENE
ncbi:MAG: SDR family NAD(P)-dependent oxidoreductase [Promethearchaeota archaeon]